MTETAKSKIKNFKNQITEKFNVGEVNGFRTYVGKLSPINVLDMLDDIERSITTDKLSVEKLQEQLNTAKKALTEITKIPESDNYFDCEECIVMMEESAKQALAAIGGDGCPVGPVGKNGLTKEELEGSGDE
ncbi:hypothetical protein [Lactococcus lactis]|uniref:hypothetical protein n=1 Tax=Lactococcus lactis TaxID=1358 RepID=UPI00207363BF|nr:hypothetical protein [Lactococcus lactis]